MSALAALFRRDGAPADVAAARAMLDAQRDRGPDAQHVWSEGSVAIGHGLLATTPEDDVAEQPLSTEAGAVVVALDGRIDNRAEIVAALGSALGSAIETRARTGAADVALVAAAYGRWGDAFAERLAGDFAVIVWDARRRTLVCARDPLGARPLYYRVDGRTVRCASSPWALFAGTRDRPYASFDAMAAFLAERYVEHGATLFQGVQALLPGATLRASASVFNVVRSGWPAPASPRTLRAPDEYNEQLRDALREAVASRMRARGRVAVHVSGGIDSASIAALAVEIARARGEPPPVLVRCVFPGLACDESAYSRAVSDHLGLPIETVTMPGDLDAYAPDPERVPRGVLSNPISFMAARMIDVARDRGARVTLTGTGSDQLMQRTGYELPDALLRADLAAVSDLSGLRAAPLSIAPYRRILRDGVRPALPARVRRAARALLGRDDGLPSWMSAAARRAVRAADAEQAELQAQAEDARARVAPRIRESLSVRCLVRRLAWDPDYSYALVLADQLAASKSAELRHPFLDRRVIELLLAFPEEQRAAAPKTKALLRRAMGDALPAAVREREDAAEFSPFVKRALVDAHGERLGELLRNGRLGEAGLVDPAAAAALVDRARRDPTVLREVVALASLEIWLRQL